MPLIRYLVARERLEADMNVFVEKVRAEGLLARHDPVPQARGAAA